MVLCPVTVDLNILSYNSWSIKFCADYITWFCCLVTLGGGLSAQFVLLWVTLVMPQCLAGMRYKLKDQLTSQRKLSDFSAGACDRKLYCGPALKWQCNFVYMAIMTELLDMTAAELQCVCVCVVTVSVLQCPHHPLLMTSTFNLFLINKLFIYLF